MRGLGLDVEQLFFCRFERQTEGIWVIYSVFMETQEGSSWSIHPTPWFIMAQGRHVANTVRPAKVRSMQMAQTVSFLTLVMRPAFSLELHTRNAPQIADVMDRRWLRRKEQTVSGVFLKLTALASDRMAGQSKRCECMLMHVSGCDYLIIFVYGLHSRDR